MAKAASSQCNALMAVMLSKSSVKTTMLNEQTATMRTRNPNIIGITSGMVNHRMTDRQAATRKHNKIRERMTDGRWDEPKTSNEILAVQKCEHT
jgi:hypothetical protein